jgi:glycosyltransferase involved in cell wall biosynthesis
MIIVVNTRLLQKNKLDGIGVFTHEILSRTVKKHPEHTFYFLFDHKPHPDFIYAKNVVPIVLLPPTKTPFLYKIWFQFRVPAFLKKIKADLFISPDGNIPLKTTVKTINVIHDLNFEHFPEFLPLKWRKYYQKHFPLFAKKANKIITVSEFSKKDITETYHIPTSKIAVVYNGVSSHFKPLNQNEKQTIKQNFTQGNPYFIFIGSLHPRKNIVGILKAFDKFKQDTNQKHKLVLAGKKMWWTNEMEQALQQLKYKDDVIFTGRIYNELLGQLLAASSGLVYVPYFEGFGIPVLEAFRCEVPVICSNTTSLPEIAGDAALKVSPQNINDIAEAMAILSGKNDISLQLIEKGKQQLALFSWDKSADDFWEIIENELKNN